MKTEAKYSNFGLLDCNYTIVLDDDEYFEITDPVVRWDDKIKIGAIKGNYNYKGWVFGNVKLKFYLKNKNAKIKTPDDALMEPWSNWKIFKSRKTKVLKRGEKGVLKGTIFEEFEKE